MVSGARIEPKLEYVVAVKAVLELAGNYGSFVPRSLILLFVESCEPWPDLVSIANVDAALLELDGSGLTSATMEVPHAEE